MSYINTLFSNYNNYYLRKAKCLSMDITENNTDKIFLKSPFDKIPKTKIPSLKKEIYIKKNHIKSLVLETLGTNYNYPINLKKINLQEYKPSEKEKQVKYAKMERFIRRSQYFSSEKGGIITDAYVKKQYNKIHLHTDSENSLDKIFKKYNKLKKIIKKIID